MALGRPPVPVEEKRRRGTYRRDRDRSLGVASVMPCVVCGEAASSEVEDFDGVVWGPFCERCGAAVWFVIERQSSDHSQERGKR